MSGLGWTPISFLYIFLKIDVNWKPPTAFDKMCGFFPKQSIFAPWKFRGLTFFEGSAFLFQNIDTAVYDFAKSGFFGFL